MTNKWECAAQPEVVRGQYEMKVIRLRGGVMRVADEYENCIDLSASDKVSDTEIEAKLPERFAPHLHIGTRLRVTVEVID